MQRKFVERIKVEFNALGYKTSFHGASCARMTIGFVVTKKFRFARSK